MRLTQKQASFPPDNRHTHSSANNRQFMVVMQLYPQESSKFFHNIPQESRIKPGIKYTGLYPANQ